jgi:hypothetical protein
MNLTVVPITLAEANGYLRRFHRHNGPLPASKLASAVVDSDGRVCGVAVAGLPKARLSMSRTTLEVNRVCTNGTKNACSMLYASMIRAGKALGYTRFITYTLQSERGDSLRASGWTAVSVFKGGKWSEMRGTGFDQHDTGAKVRWESGEASTPAVNWPKLDDPQGELDLGAKA